MSIMGMAMAQIGIWTSSSNTFSGMIQDTRNPTGVIGIFIFIVGVSLVGILLANSSNSKYRYSTKRRAFTPETKELVLDRQGHCCNICGVNPDNWDFDHIGSRGDNSPSNCQALCLDCHRDKTNKESRQRKRR